MAEENKKESEDGNTKDAVWINCMVKVTPKGYSVWIPKGAFKDVEMDNKTV